MRGGAAEKALLCPAFRMVALALPRPNLSLSAFSFSITDMKSGPLAHVFHGLAGRTPNLIGLRAVNGKGTCPG
jgi:hypothetical protein